MCKKLTVLTAAFFVSATLASAQDAGVATDNSQVAVNNEDKPWLNQPLDVDWMWSETFEHLDLHVELGTTGIGLQLSTPLTKWARVRTGFTYMPPVEVPMTFGIQVGNDPAKSKNKLEKMSRLIHDNFGMTIDDAVDMTGKPSNFWNWNVILDFYPLKNNKHWHISGGFYLGPSRIAKAYNETEAMQSLLAVNIYNSMYSKLVNDRVEYYMQQGTDHYIPEVLYEVSLFDFSAMGGSYEGIGINNPELLQMLYKRFKDYGLMGVHVGDYINDAFYTEDVPVLEADGTPMVDDDGNPVIAHHKGDLLHAAGDPYIMRPDITGMVKAEMRVKQFKPYVGIGYEGSLSKKDDRWKIAVDGGVLFWGGSPSVVTHEGVDLVHDVKNVSGKVGSYVNAIDKFKVYPMLSVRVTRRLF